VSKIVPESLRDYILPFNWNVHKVWALEANVVQVPCSDFVHLLRLPLWSSKPNQGLLFDLCPMDVIRNPNISIHQAKRLQETQLRYPIDVLVMNERRWILDGVHRLAKHFVSNSSVLSVRFHDESIFPAIEC
jgi:hypothetical protein